MTIKKVIIGSLLELNIITFFALEFVCEGLGQKTYYHHNMIRRILSYDWPDHMNYQSSIQMLFEFRTHNEPMLKIWSKIAQISHKPNYYVIWNFNG